MANTKVFGVRGPYRIVTLPVKSDAAFKQGDFVLFTTSGLTAAASAGSNYAAASSNATRIAGRAMTDAIDPNTNAVRTYAEIIIAEPGVSFQVPLYNATPASAVPALAQLGTAYEMRQASGGFPQIDTGNTGNAHAYIVDFDPTDCPAWPTSITGGVQYANVWVEYKGTACLLTGAR